MEQELKFEGDVNDAGEPEGVWRATFPDGAPQAEIHFEKGKRHGESKSWYANGTQASLESYHKDILHGAICYWNESGMPTLSGWYRYGVKHGHWELWTPDGKQTLDAGYAFGKAHGLQRQFLPWRVEPIDHKYVHGVLVEYSSPLPLEPPRGWFYRISMLCLVAAVGMIWFKAPMAIYALMAYGVTIAVHEAGHLIAARWMGIPIKSFSIGVGWRLLSYYSKGTLFHLRLLPLLGYTEPYAMRQKEFEHWSRYSKGDRDVAAPHRLPTIDIDQPDRSADEWVALWRRAAFYLGGVAANLLLATVILWVGLWPEQPLRAIQASSQLCVACWEIIPASLNDLTRPSDQPPVEFDLFAGLDSAWRGPPLAPPPVEGELTDAALPPNARQLPAALLFAALNLAFVSIQILPIPLLDGYRVVEAAIETLIRRPVPPLAKLIARVLGGLTIGIILVSVLVFVWPRLLPMI